MDFVSDALFDVRRSCSLAVFDNFSRECLAIVMGQNLRGQDVVETPEHLRTECGSPRRVQVDGEPEFISIVLDKWVHNHGVTGKLSRPGEPADSAFVESFNGSVRDECLNVHWFLFLDDARQRIEKWRTDYSHFRPHSSLGNAAPAQFAEEFLQPRIRRFLYRKAAQDLGGRQAGRGNRKVGAVLKGTIHPAA